MTIRCVGRVMRQWSLWNCVFSELYSIHICFSPIIKIFIGFLCMSNKQHCDKNQRKKNELMANKVTFLWLKTKGNAESTLKSFNWANSFRFDAFFLFEMNSHLEMDAEMTEICGIRKKSHKIFIFHFNEKATTIHLPECVQFWNGNAIYLFGWFEGIK